MGNKLVSNLPVFILISSLLGCLTGCATTPGRSTPVAHLYTETMETFGEESFLQCVEPVSVEEEDRDQQEEEWASDDYYTDKRNANNPASLKISDNYHLELSSFKKSGITGNPYLKIQLRECEKGLKAKVWKIQTPMFDSNHNLVHTKYSTEEVPKYYKWMWEPECETIGGEPIKCEVVELKNKPGICYAFEGELDNEGVIILDLKQFMKLGAMADNGLTFHFWCESEGVSCNVIVPRDVFRWYR